MSNGGWPQAVAHEIGLPHPLHFKSHEGGSTAAFLECSTCPKEIEWLIPKRFPPEVFKKKMQQMGWDTRKRRCPACVTSGRKTPLRGREHVEPPVTNNLQQKLAESFAKVLPIVPEEAHMDARIAINPRNVSISVPFESKLFSLFVTDSFQPKAFWKIQIVDRPDGEPIVKIVNVDGPAAGVKVRGMGRGSYAPSTGLFSLVTQAGLIEGADKLGHFRATASKLIKQGPRELTFELPLERKPPMLRGQFKETDQEPVAPDPVVETGAEPQMAHEPEAPPTQPPCELTSSKAVSLKQAVDIVNKFKDKMGDCLELKVTSTGKLRVMAEYGDTEHE